MCNCKKHLVRTLYKRWWLSMRSREVVLETCCRHGANHGLCLRVPHFLRLMKCANVIFCTIDQRRVDVSTGISKVSCNEMGGNSSPLHDSQGVDELATLDRYHHFHGHSGLCA